MKANTNPLIKIIRSFPSVGLILFLFLQLTVTPVFAQNQLSNFGKDFWLAFAQNNSPASASLRLYMTSKVNTQATVSTSGASTTYNITADSTTEVILNANTFSAILRITNPSVENKGINIRSNDDITVFASNVQNYTTDATVVLPTTALGIGSEYMLNMSVLQTSPSGLLFVATEDSTVIRFYNQPSGFPDSITLNRFQVYMIPYYNNATTIRAESRKDCKPFAVFFTNRCTNVGGCSACDHIYTQMLPISKWSTQYIATPLLNQTVGYEYSIVALHDSTTVTINGGTPFMLQRGQRSRGSINTQIITCFDADKPINVQQLLKGVTCHGSGPRGDPAIVELNATNQSVPRATFSSLTGGFITQHYVNIIVDSAFKHLLLIDSLPPKTNNWMSTLGCGRYAVYRDAISAGSHTIINDSGFIAYAYGLTSAESYLYSIGASYENQIYNFNIIADKRCPGENVRVQKVGDELRSVYFLQGNRVDSGNVANYVFNSPGRYKVQMVAFTFDSECADTITKFIEIGGPPKVFPNDTTICNPFEIIVRIDTSLVDSFKWDIPNYTADTLLIDTRGKYKVLLVDTFGCTYTDSVFVYLYRDPIAGLVVPDFSCFGAPSTFINRSIDTSQITDLRYYLVTNDSIQTYFTDSILNLVVGDTGEFKGVFVASNGGVCNDTLSFSTQIRPRPDVAFTIDTGQLCLRNNQFNFTNQTQGFSYNLTYRWHFGDGDTSAATSPSHSYPNSGAFAPKLIATSNFGCTDSLSKAIQVFANPKSNFTLSDTFSCFNQQRFSASSTATLASDTLQSFIWLYTNNRDTAQQLSNITFDSTGVYGFTHIVVSNKGCADTLLRQVFVSPNPEAKYASNSLAQCFKGNEFNFVDSSKHILALSQQIWEVPGLGLSDTGAQFSLRLAQVDSFDFLLRVSDSLGCADTVTGKFIVHPQAEARIAASDTLDCFRYHSFDFSSQSSILYGDITSSIWEYAGKRDSAVNLQNIKFDSVGSYNVRHIVSSQFNCADTTTVTIQVKPHPNAQLWVANQSSCLKGNTFNFVDSSQHTSNIVLSRWEIPALNHTDTGKTWSYAFPYADTFVVSLQVVDAFGCWDSTETQLTVHPQSTLSFVTDTACLRDSIFLQSTSQVSSGSIVQTDWDFGNGQSASGAATSYLYDQTGRYTITLKTETDKGCKDTLVTANTVLIRPLPKPIFTANSPVCENELMRITNQTVDTGQHANADYFINWYGNQIAQNNKVFELMPQDTGIQQFFTYAVNQFGCADSSPLDFRVIPSPVADFLFPFTIQCLRGNIFEAQNLSQGLGYPLTYEWDFGAGITSTVFEPVFSYPANGSYPMYLTVKNNFGCESTKVDTFLIDFYPAPNLSLITLIDSQCFLGNQFVFANNTSITSGSFETFLGFDGVDTVAISDTLFYTFSKTGLVRVDMFVNTDLQCKDTISQFIRVWEMPEALHEVNILTGCEGQTTFEFTNLSTANEPLIYTWHYDGIQQSDSMQSLTHVFANFGSYTVDLEAISPNNCRDTFSIPININPVPRPVAFAPDPEQCFAFHNFDLFSNTTLALGDYESYWDVESHGGFSGDSVLDLRFTDYGSMVIRYKAVSDSLCADSVQFNLQINPNPLADFTVDKTAACLRNNLFELQSNASLVFGTIDSVIWTDELYSVLGTGNTMQVSFIDSGFHDIIQRVVTDKGCSDTFVQAVRLYQNPIALFSAQFLDSCFYTNALQVTDLAQVFNGQGNAVFEFSDASVYTNQAAFVHTFDQLDTFTIRYMVEDAQTCADTTEQQVIVRPQPLAQIALDEIQPCLSINQFVFKDSTLSHGVSYQRRWEFRDELVDRFDSIVNYSFATEGLKTIYLHVEGPYACSTSDTITVAVFPKNNLSFDVSNPAYCLNEQDFKLLYNGAVPFVQLRQLIWAFADTTFDNQEFVTKKFADTGSFSNVLITENTFGCFDTLSFELEVKPLPTVDFVVNDSMWCLRNQALELNSLADFSEGNIAAYFWEFSDATTANGAVVNNKLFVSSGIYDVLHIAVADNNCRDSFVRKIEFYDNPVAAFVSDTFELCERGHSFSVNAATNFAQAMRQHYWSIPSIGLSDSGQALNVQFSQYGNYGFELISVDNHGCADTIEGLLKVYPQSDIAFLADTICFGQTSSIRDLSTLDSGSIINREWSLGDLSSHTGPNVSHLFPRPDAFNVQLITTTDAGCKDTLFAAGASLVRSLPVAGFSYQKTFDSMQYTGYQFANLSTGNTPLNYAWTFDRYGFSSASNPYWAFPDTGRMFVNLLVTDLFGCENQLTQDFVTYPETLPYIPNAFSPNQDGLNDMFKLQGVAYTMRFRMQIFNRWGEMLFETTDLNQAWDGTFNNVEVPPGVYMYKINFVTLHGRFVQKFGDLTLLR